MHPLRNPRGKSGQALLEYLLVFSMMALISVGLVRAVTRAMNSSMYALTVALTDKLSTGVCPVHCYYNKYKNGIEQ